jgi:hypothetical protein
MVGTSGTGLIVDDDLLTPDLGELFGDDPRVDVCRPARSKRHNNVERFDLARDLPGPSALGPARLPMHQLKRSSDDV